VNVVSFTGYLGADPETKIIDNGTQLTKMKVAVADFTGKAKETYWFPVVTFGKTAEFCSNHLKKGTFVGISGKLTQRTYEDKEGNKHLWTEIIAYAVTFEGPKNSGDSPQEPAKSPPVQNKNTPETSRQPVFPDTGDDIPF
jgi:single-strand DNA-binding protein